MNAVLNRKLVMFVALGIGTLMSLTSGWAANTRNQVEKEGIQVHFSIHSPTPDPTNTDVDAADRLVTGEHRLFRFQVQDSTGAPLKGLYPAAWVHGQMKTPVSDDLACQNKLKTFLSGSLFSQAELDLNVYHVLTLNDDASVSVVDPIFGFGGSKLLTMVPLPAMGYDWAMDTSAGVVYISIPTLHQLVKLDTLQWQVSQVLTGEQWRHPRQLKIQPDQHYLWVAVDKGIAVFERKTLRFIKQLPLAKTESESEFTEFVFSPDSRFLYVAEKTTGILSIIDTGSLAVIKQIQLGKHPAYLAYSFLAGALYISQTGDGRIIVVDGQRHEIIAEAQSEPGLGMIRFSPDGRWGFIVNPVTDRLSILDAADNQIVQTGLVEKEPESINFSNELAYIRHRGSHTILMVTLDSREIGRPGRPIPVVDMPAGDQPAGLQQQPTPAAGIVQAPGANAMLIANAGDQTVYFYKEGMAAPMGQFGNYGKSPRAVLAIDRSLKERQQAGIYQTVAELPATPGIYDVVYFMNSPRMIHCFEIQVHASDPDLALLQPISIEKLPSRDILKVGNKVNLYFQLRGTAEQVATPVSIDSLVMLTSGRWQQRSRLHSDSDGVVPIRFTPPLAGVYRVFLNAENIGLDSSTQQFMIEVKQ